MQRDYVNSFKAEEADRDYVNSFKAEEAGLDRDADEKLLSPPSMSMHRQLSEEGKSLLDAPLEVDGQNTTAAVELLASEYLSSGLCELLTDSDKPMAHARTIVRPLLEQCEQTINHGDGKYRGTGKMTPDGAMLMRFLAHKGVE